MAERVVKGRHKHSTEIFDDSAGHCDPAPLRRRHYRCRGARYPKWLMHTMFNRHHTRVVSEIRCTHAVSDAHSLHRPRVFGRSAVPARTTAFGTFDLHGVVQDSRAHRVLAALAIPSQAGREHRGRVRAVPGIAECLTAADAVYATAIKTGPLPLRNRNSATLPRKPPPSAELFRPITRMSAFSRSIVARI